MVSVCLSDLKRRSMNLNYILPLELSLETQKQTGGDSGELMSVLYAPVFLPLNCTGGLSAHKHIYVVVLKSSTGPLRAPLSFFYN